MGAYLHIIKGRFIKATNTETNEVHTVAIAPYFGKPYRVSIFDDENSAATKQQNYIRRIENKVLKREIPKYVIFHTVDEGEETEVHHTNGQVSYYDEPDYTCEGVQCILTKKKGKYYLHSK